MVCVCFTFADDRDLTRPEYVVSDMLRPLPQFDLSLVSFDSPREASSAVRPLVSTSVSDFQSDGLSRPSYAAVIHGADVGDAASHVSSDDSLSVVNNTGPGMFYKRHNMSPFRRRADKKSPHVTRGCGRGVRRCPFSDTAVGQPVFSGVGRGVRAISHPVFIGRGRGFQCVPLSETSLEQSVTNAWADGLCFNARSQSELQQSQLDDELNLSSAACEDNFLHAERRCTPPYLTRCQQSVNDPLLVDTGQSSTVQSAASVGAADVGSDSPLQHRQSKVRRRGRDLFLVEQSDDSDVDTNTDTHDDTELELMKFERPVR